MSSGDLHCGGCGTALVLAPGIDWYCPNTACDHDKEQVRVVLQAISARRPVQVSRERLDAYAALEAAAKNVMECVGDVDASSVYMLGEALAALRATAVGTDSDGGIRA